MKQTDIYTEALSCLRLILWADHPEFQNWIDWLERDIQDWTQRREVAHHLRAYGGMGSFNDLPSMCGNHDYIFGFLKSVCYTFGHLYNKRGRSFSGRRDGGMRSRHGAGRLLLPQGTEPSHCPALDAGRFAGKLG